MKPDQWVKRTEKRALKLYEIERAAAEQVSKPIQNELAAIMQGLAVRYIREFGSLYVRDIDPAKLAIVTSWLITELKHVDLTKVQSGVLNAAKEGYQHGHISAHLNMRERPPKVTPKLSDEIKVNALDAAKESRARLVSAVKLVEKAESWGDLSAAMAKAHQSATTARGYAEWSANRSAAEAVTKIEKSREGWTRVWVNERDSCVHCAAYAGITVDKNGKFPGGLTFGEKAVRDEPFEHPPLHRHCRCRPELIRIDDTAIPAALKREAARSIAKGWALPSESDKVRLAATKKLLDSKAKSTLPKTVIKEAERAVKKGKFKPKPANL